MAEKPKKTLDQLTDEISRSELGLSPEDIASLFTTEQGVVPQAGTTTNPPTPEAQTGQTAPASQTPATSQQEEAGGTQEQPLSVNELLPEKFRDKDPKQSIAKIAKSYEELEREHHKKSEDLSRLSKYVQDLINKAQQAQQQQTQPAQQQTPPQQQEDDTTFFERPRDEVRKLIQELVPQIVMAGIQQYDTFSTRRQLINEFKREHPDIDNYGAEIAEVLKERPELDRDPSALPRIYELAKDKHSSKYKKVAEQIGVVDREKLLADAVEMAKAKILEEVRQRKAASGTTAGTIPTTPTERIAPKQTTQPLSPEEELFRQMLDAGPKRMTLE